MKKFLVWSILSLFLVSPYGAFAQSIPGPSVSGGTTATIIPPLPLPTGAATSALQLADGHNVTVDNAAGASAVNIQDGGNSITVDALALPLPTGAATEATLSGLNSKVPSLGAALTASSLPVNIASDQTVPISAAALPLPTGAATEATLVEVLEDLRDENTPAIQNLDSNFNAVIDNIGSPVTATAGLVRGNGVQIDAILTALIDADGDLAIPRVDANGAMWVRAGTVTKELFAGVSTTSSSNIIDTAGYTVGMVHYTNDATFDRTGTFAINVSVGASSPFKPVVGAIEVRQSPGPENVWQHTDPEAISLNPVANRTRGYLVNLMGFQALQVEVTITGAGTSGTSEFHIHLYSSGSGFNQEMSLGTDSDIAPIIGGRPPLIQFIGGRSTSNQVSMRALFLPDEDAPHTSGDAGILPFGVANTSLTNFGANLDYTPFATDLSGIALGIPMFSSQISSSRRATHQVASGHASGNAGFLALAVENEAGDALTAAEAGNYSPIGVDSFGSVQIANGFTAFHVAVDNIPSTGLSSFTITDTAIAAVSQNFAFGFTSEKLLISTPATNTDDVCIDHNGGSAICPALDTAGDDRIPPGGSLVLDNHIETSVSAIAASGTQTVTIRAFN